MATGPVGSQEGGRVEVSLQGSRLPAGRGALQDRETHGEEVAGRCHSSAPRAAANEGREDQGRDRRPC